jgi:phage portal protein BeeE
MSNNSLTRRQSAYLAHSPDFDLTLSEARRLAKRAGTGLPHDEGRRRRTTPNIWTTFEGRGQPRQGFLSTEVMRMVYLRSEVVRACVDTLVELVCGCDWAIQPKDEERAKWMRGRKPDEYRDQKKRIRWLEKFFGKPNTHETLDAFHRVLLRDLLIYDAGAYEVVKASVKGRLLPLELGGVAGDTVEIECSETGIPMRYWQSYNTKINVDFELDELAYIKLNPVSWSPYGVSPIETAYVSIASDLNANKYNAQFFEKNGIPPALLAVMGLSGNEFKHLMAQMRQTSRDNPWNIHAFRAGRDAEGKSQQVFELVPLSQISNKEMQFTELLTHVVRRITMLYRISPSQIGFTDEVTGGIGSGVAETQVDLMESKGVAPLLKKLEETHTEEVIERVCGWGDLEFKFVQSQTPKEQQEYQRDAGEVTMGAMTINELRSKWGGREAVDWGDLPLQPPPGWQPPMSPEQMQQQMMQAQMGMGGPMPGQDPTQQNSGAPGMTPGQPPTPPGPPTEGMAQQEGLNKSAGEKRIVIRW